MPSCSLLFTFTLIFFSTGSLLLFTLAVIVKTTGSSLTPFAIMPKYGVDAFSEMPDTSTTSGLLLTTDILLDGESEPIPVRVILEYSPAVAPAAPSCSNVIKCITLFLVEPRLVL